MDRSWIFDCNESFGFIQYSEKTLLIYFNDWLIPKYGIWDFKKSLDYTLSLETDPDLSDQALKNQVREQIRIEVNNIMEVSNAGYFFPRISKNMVNFDFISNESLQDLRSFQNILKAFDEIANFVELDEINMNTYSHKIRELLILSCTEVEYLMKKLLIDNNYSTTRRYLNTIDYYNCKEILKLDGYSVELKKYKDLKVFKPFSNWSEGATTETLPWYAAYNAVKHDRGGNFTQANLKNLMDSIAAIHILLEAQYGKNIFNGFHSIIEDKSLFLTTTHPEWELKDICVPKLKIGPQREVLTEWLGTKFYFNEA